MMKVAILVGGKGKRLGYTEKPLLNVCGKKIIERLINCFLNCDLVIICRDKRQSKTYSKFSKTLVDEFKYFGPIAGIYTALNYFNDFTLIVGGDMPFVKREVAEEIYNMAKKLKVDALIPHWKEDKYEPLLACYSPSALPQLKKGIIKKEKKIMNVILGLKNIFFYPINELKKIDKNLISFFNINTQEDLRRAEEICSLTDMEEL